MGTGDISRIGFDPRKHYTSVRMQQGRVIVDEDWNENERIRGDETRRTNSEVVGAWGASGSGFQIRRPRLTDDGKVEFDIASGTLHLGGLRLTLEQSTSSGIGETYTKQADRPGAPSVQPPTDGRMDLVYVEAWQQPVSAAEDGELLDPALGGPDTTTRVRNMRRVLVKEGVGADCRQAMQKLAESWAAGSYDRNTCERVTDVLLRASFDPAQAGSDPCKPAVAGGYLGAENQAIRIQLVDGSHFTWGFDNAYPLYRVKKVEGVPTESGEEGVSLARVTLETFPADEAHHIRAGQVVELLGRAAELANGEPVAETAGILLRAASDFEPGAGQFSIDLDALPLEAIQDAWFIRVWNRGSDTESQPLVEFGPGEEKLLGHTGLKVTLEGTHFITGDYWVVAVRPATARRAYPWSDPDGAGLPPHGLRRFYAPLAILKWTKQEQGFSGQVIRDCRKRFRPLTEQMVCCTFTVGDGVRTHGDFDTLAEALANLPPEGGVIGMMPGQHTASVTIAGRHNVTIRGCERQTEVSAEDKDIFTVSESTSIVLEEMDLLAPEGTAIVVAGVARPSDVRIRCNRIMAGVSAIKVDGADRVSINDNLVRMLDRAGADVALYVDADDCEVSHNDISVTRSAESPFDDKTAVSAGSVATLGGVQIAAGSDRVRVCENLIANGAGNGIALGSHIGEKELEILTNEDPEPKLPVKPTVPPQGDRGIISGIIQAVGKRVLAKQVVMLEHKTTGELRKTVTDRYGKFSFMGVPEGEYRLKPPPHVGLTGLTKVKEKQNSLFKMTVRELTPAKPLAFVRDIVIRDNRISNMGMCGISNMRYAAKRQQLAKSVVGTRLQLEGREYVQLGSPCADLTIHGNVIVGCLANDFENLSEQARARVLGGITLTLCSDLDISENRVEENGLKYAYPVCGIFVAYGERVTIDHNYVCNNGQLTAEEEELVAGIRGGIVVTAVSLPVLSVASRGRLPAVSKHLPTRIHGNVVEQPAGRALEVWALGPLAVVGNQLSTAVDPDGRYGAVMIVNAGRSARGASPDGTVAEGSEADPQLLAYNPVELPAGSVLFSDNQVLAGGPRFTSPGAIHVMSLHDIGFCNNVSDYESASALGQNTYLQSSETIRAIGNRFRETVRNEVKLRPSGSTGKLEWLSLLSMARLANNTAHNQADHCIVAFRGSTHLASDYEVNEVLAEPDGCKTFCKGLDGKLDGTGGTKPLRPADDFVCVLSELRQQVMFAGNLVRNEAAALNSRYGDQHRTVGIIAENYSRCAEVGLGLKVEEEAASIETPELETGGGTIAVRTAGVDGAGVAGQDVVLRAKDGRVITEFSGLLTDMRGNLTLNLAPQQILDLQKTYGSDNISLFVGGVKTADVPLTGSSFTQAKVAKQSR